MIDRSAILDRLNAPATPRSGPRVNGQAARPDAADGKPEAHGRGGRRKRKDRATAKPRPRWWNVLASFVDNRLAGVSPGAVAVWLILFRNSRDGRVCIAVERIADAAGMSERSARYKIEELANAGIIEAKARGNRIKGPTVYRLNTESTGNGLPPATGNGLPPFQEKSADGHAERVPSAHGNRKRRANGDACGVAFASSSDGNRPTEGEAIR